MQTLKLDRPAAAQALPLSLVAAVGATDFGARLLATFGKELPASHCTVFALRSNGRVDAVASASAVGELAALTAAEYLRRGFDRLDSNMAWLSGRKAGRHTGLWLRHQVAADVPDPQYRLVCYDEPGIRERLSLLAVFPDGYRVAISFYRNHSYPPYDAGDFGQLAQHGPLLAAAVMRHVQVSRRPAAERQLHQRIMSELSFRERQVIAHVLGGLTTKEAAREMGVSATTAATYRYRAFQHLGIRSHRELLALLGGAPG